MSRLKKKLDQTDLDLADLLNDDIEDKILTPEEERRKKIQHIAAIVAGALSIILIAGVIIFSNLDKEKKPGGKLLEELESTTTTQVVTKEQSNDLVNEKYPEISELIQLYYKAKLTGDVKSLEKYIDNIEDVNMDQIKAQNKYIKKYNNIDCYTKMGLYDNTYVVFAYYDIKFKNIDTTAPGIDVLYVIRDEDTGLVYLHNGATSNSDIKNYVDALKNDEDVKKLFEDTDAALKEALASDSNLKSFYNSLINGSKSDKDDKKK